MPTSPNFDKISKFTLLSEGPMSNDKYDPGGLTKYGFAQNMHPELDVQNLTQQMALDKYYTDYYVPAQCEDLPFAFALAAFECSVNQGLPTHLRLLQQAIGVAVDGNFGPASKKALLLVRDRPRVLAYFQSLRVQHYVAIKDSNPMNYETNHNGWFIRMFLGTMLGAST